MFPSERLFWSELNPTELSGITVLVICLPTRPRTEFDLLTRAKSEIIEKLTVLCSMVRLATTYNFPAFRMAFPYLL